VRDPSSFVDPRKWALNSDPWKRTIGCHFSDANAASSIPKYNCKMTMSATPHVPSVGSEN